MKVWKQFWQQNKERKIYIIAITACILATLASLCFGAAKLTIPQILDLLRPEQLSEFFTNGAKNLGYAGIIFWTIRLPRTAACLLAGAALAVAGTVIQGVLANKLASPSIIGVNAGAGLAVTICCAMGAISGWAIAGASFFGALLAVLLISLTAQKLNASRTTVILGGVAINSFLNAGTEAITTLIPEAGMLTADFRAGGFSAVSHIRLIPAGILILIALVIVMTLHNELDLMNLGEDMAQGLGLSVKKMRTIFLALAALLAGASVSFAGLLGFIGLIIPHAMRGIVGGENRILIPMCALGGATFVTICDVFSRLAFAPHEVPVGILMSFIGGPFFIWLLLKKRGGRF